MKTLEQLEELAPADLDMDTNLGLWELLDGLMTVVAIHRHSFAVAAGEQMPWNGSVTLANGVELHRAGSK